MTITLAILALYVIRSIEITETYKEYVRLQKDIERMVNILANSNKQWGSTVLQYYLNFIYYRENHYLLNYMLFKI